MVPGAGLGLKPEHFPDALGCTARGLWFEVHAENYMAAGGPRIGWLHAIRSRHPVSLHGVGLSLAADVVPDARHLERLAALVERIEPTLVSEHLAWSSRGGAYLPDLLPFPRTRHALHRIADNIGRVQDRIGRRIALENPSHYVRIDGHEYDEIAFLAELARRTGCGLLLDVNNVFVSANNLGFDANAWIDQFPGPLVDEVHLAGHTPDPALGAALLIDSHDAPVDELVWALYRRLVARIGPRPTLIERDGCLPSFDTLLAEREIAQAVLSESQVGDASAMRTGERDAMPSEAHADRCDDAASLGCFQDAFARALFVPVSHPMQETAGAAVAALEEQPGFAVYRNTVMLGLIDTLRSNYPSVARIVGNECFEAVAACFARYTPPTHPCLADYGEGFACFVEAIAPKARLPFLADVARLDRFWTEAHLAADAPRLDATAVTRVGVEEAMDTVLVPHPSARWAWFDRHPVLTIWRLCREGEGEGEAETPVLHPEGALLVRPHDTVIAVPIDRAACVFLDACAQGRPLAACAQAAFDETPHVDLVALLGTLFRVGAFAQLRRLSRSARTSGPESYHEPHYSPGVSRPLLAARSLVPVVRLDRVAA